MTDEDCELDALGERLARPLRGAERLPEDFEARLLTKVRHEARQVAPRAGGARDVPRGAAPAVRDLAGMRRAKRWVLEPRAVRVSPARAFLLAAGLVAAAALGGRALGPSTDGAAGTVAAAPRVADLAARDTVRLVQFVLVAPDARTVSLVGDFNDWAPGATPLRTVGGGGVWSVALPLEAGRYQYAFIVNGERWVLDPAAPRAVEESFGTPNSVVTVGERSS